MTPLSDERHTLHTARACLARLLPALSPFSDPEVRSLTLEAGVLALTAAARPQHLELTSQLQRHLDRMRQPGRNQRQLLLPRSQQRDSDPPTVGLGREQYEPSLQRMQRFAHQVGLPWFTRQTPSKHRTQVSYRVTKAFERALDEAWRSHAPHGGTRNALQATLVLAYLSVPEVRQRVQAVQDLRYGQATPSPATDEDGERVAQVLRRCSIPARGAPTLRHQVVQLSYRTTLPANSALRRSLLNDERTMAYLHIDLLALYLTAPDIRTLGKNSVIGFALSVWTREEEVRMSSGSTVKGAQDAATRFPDLPVFLDDLHTLSETPEGQQALRQLSLGFGGGQQRRTSTPTLEAQGGQERFGVAFYAAEHAMAEKITGGAQMRTVELAGPPLPADTKAVADRLKRAARAHGQLGALLAEQYNTRTPELLARVSQREATYQARYQAVADDAVTLALLHVSLELMQEVTGVTVPVEQAVSLFAQRAEERRRETDDARRVMRDLLRALQEGAWTQRRRGDGKAQRVLMDAEQGVAFDDETGYDVRPGAPLVAQVFDSYGGLINRKDILSKWRAREWIATTRRDAFTVSRATEQTTCEVWRITLKARNEADRKD